MTILLVILILGLWFWYRRWSAAQALREDWNRLMYEEMVEENNRRFVDEDRDYHLDDFYDPDATYGLDDDDDDEPDKPKKESIWGTPPTIPYEEGETVSIWGTPLKL